MKTRKEWFETLKPKFAKKAIKYTIKENGKETLNEPYETLFGALWSAFTFDNTPEHHQFWSDIAFGRNTDFLKNEE